jgi:acyl dehydratase
MKLPPTGPAARFFDDLAVGDRFTTQGRTFTPADGLMWAMFSGDMNPMHVDEEFAREYGIYGGVFPPGLAVVGIASGLNERLGLFVGTGLAMTGQTIRYRRPVLPGDTIRVQLEVRTLTPHPRRPAGTAEFGYEIVTTDGRVCIEGEWGIMLAARSMVSGMPTPGSD